MRRVCFHLCRQFGFLHFAPNAAIKRLQNFILLHLRKNYEYRIIYIELCTKRIAFLCLIYKHKTIFSVFESTFECHVPPFGTKGGECNE